MSQTYAIIVAAGTGSRFGSSIPKQFVSLGRDGVPVLVHTLRAFLSADISHSNIRVVLSHAMMDYWQELCDEYGFQSPAVVEGGMTRFHSVRNALRTLQIESEDKILVHDGARPLIIAPMIRRVIEALDDHRAVIPVIAVTDSIRAVGAGKTSTVVDRSTLRAVQTPQGFDAKILQRAYETDYKSCYTDDASVVEAAGVSVTLIPGDASNIKITNPADLFFARAWMDAINEDATRK